MRARKYSSILGKADSKALDIYSEIINRSTVDLGCDTKLFAEWT
jgi:hypothetical protein